MRQTRHLRHHPTMQLLVLALDLPARDKRLQPAVEICHACTCIDDGQDNQDDGDDGKAGQGMADGIERVVAGGVLGLVHADEFEEEVGEGAEVEELESRWVRGDKEPRDRGLTMVMTTPALFSLRVNSAAIRRMMIVTGIAAMVT